MAAAKRRYDDANKANGWKMVIPYGHKLFRPRIAKHSPKLLIHDEERIPCWWIAVQKGALEMCVGATFTCDEETPWRMIAYKPPHQLHQEYQLPCPAKLSPAPSLRSPWYWLQFSMCIYRSEMSLYIALILGTRLGGTTRPYQTRPDRGEYIYVESLIEQFQRLIN